MGLIGAKRRRTLLPPGILAIPRAWLSLLALGALLGALVSLTVANFTPATYLGQVTLLMTPRMSTSEVALTDIEVTQALAPTFAELSTTAPLLQRVIDSTKVDMDVAELERNVTTDAPAGTGLINIDVSDRDPAMAAALANAIAAQLVDPDGVPEQQASALSVTLTVVDPARPRSAPDGLGLLPTTGLGAVIGLLAAIIMASVIEIVGGALDPPGPRATTGPSLGNGPDRRRQIGRRDASWESGSTPG